MIATRYTFRHSTPVLAAGLVLLALLAPTAAARASSADPTAHHCVTVDLGWKRSGQSNGRSLDIPVGGSFRTTVGRNNAQLAIVAEITLIDAGQYHARGTVKFRNPQGKLAKLELDHSLPFSSDLPGGRGSHSHFTLNAVPSTPRLAALGYWTAENAGWGRRAPDLLPMRTRQGPRYPKFAELSGTTGDVLLRVLATSQGAPLWVGVERASPRCLFDRTAIETAMSWTFPPAVTLMPWEDRYWAMVPMRFRFDP